MLLNFNESFVISRTINKPHKVFLILAESANKIIPKKKYNQWFFKTVERHQNLPPPKLPPKKLKKPLYHFIKNLLFLFLFLLFIEQKSFIFRWYVTICSKKEWLYSIELPTKFYPKDLFTHPHIKCFGWWWWEK